MLSAKSPTSPIPVPIVTCTSAPPLPERPERHKALKNKSSTLPSKTKSLPRQRITSRDNDASLRRPPSPQIGRMPSPSPAGRRSSSPPPDIRADKSKGQQQRRQTICVAENPSGRPLLPPRNRSGSLTAPVSFLPQKPTPPTNPGSMHAPSIPERPGDPPFHRRTTSEPGPQSVNPAPDAYLEILPTREKSNSQSPELLTRSGRRVASTSKPSGNESSDSSDYEHPTDYQKPRKAPSVPRKAKPCPPLPPFNCQDDVKPYHTVRHSTANGTVQKVSGVTLSNKKKTIVLICKLSWNGSIFFGLEYYFSYDQYISETSNQHTGLQIFSSVVKNISSS